jgi:hypothetical protein
MFRLKTANIEAVDFDLFDPSKNRTAATALVFERY